MIPEARSKGSKVVEQVMGGVRRKEDTGGRMNSMRESPMVGEGRVLLQGLYKAWVAVVLD